jgi:hypothetical protein
MTEIGDKSVIGWWGFESQKGIRRQKYTQLNPTVRAQLQLQNRLNRINGEGTERFDFKGSEHSIIYLISRWQHSCDNPNWLSISSILSLKVKSSQSPLLVLFIHILHTTRRPYKVCPDPNPREAK